MTNNHELFHSIQQLSRHLSKYINEVLQPYGLYSSQWSVLYTLKTVGSLTQAELCDYLSVEAPSMSRMTQRLIKQGYVAYHLGEDKRKKHLSLTDKALQEYPLWEQSVLTENQLLAATLPQPSREQLHLLIAGWNKQLKRRRNEHE